MNPTCPDCGRSIGVSRECSFCGFQPQKMAGRVGSLLITMLIIGAMIAGTLFAISLFGNPFDFIKRVSPKEYYEVTLASDNLPIAAAPKESITLKQMAALREHFENQQFGKLNAIFEEYQRGFEANPNDEYKVYDAFRSFAGTLPRYEELLNNWVNYSPARYAPYLARANYYYAKGWESRGNSSAKDTSEAQFSMMHEYLRQAAEDVNMAININPNLLAAYYIQIGIFNTVGDDDGKDETFRRALELFPSSFLIGSRFMWAKAPRWGGTYREMETFAKEAEHYADLNPELTALYGFIYYDQSRRLVGNKKYKDAAKLCSKALLYGDNWLFYYQRASIYYYHLDDLTKALYDIDRSISLRPTMEKSYRLRSKIYYSTGDMDNALDDLQTAEFIKPGDTKTQKWRLWAADRLMDRGHRVFKKDLNQAIEQYNLSIKFDPETETAYYWRGVAFYRLKEMETARLDFAKAIDINPHHFDAYLMMDYVLMESRQWDKIIAYWNQFLDLEPDHARAYLERSGTYYHRKDYAKSLEDLKTACDLGSKKGCQDFAKYKDIRKN